MSAAVADALTRLEIVIAASDGLPASPLLSLEAFTAVTGFLNSMGENTCENDPCIPCDIIRALAFDGLTLSTLALDLKGDAREAALRGLTFTLHALTRIHKSEMGEL